MSNPGNDIQDTINNMIDVKLNITPFYVGHVEGNKIAIADKNGRPCAWVYAGDVMPLPVALSLAREVAKLMNDRFDIVMNEYDEQTGDLSKMKSSGKEMGERLSMLLALLSKGPGDGTSGFQGFGNV